MSKVQVKVKLKVNVKAKLFYRLNKYKAMKSYGEMEAQLHALTSSLEAQLSVLPHENWSLVPQK